ncbi:hypothetical protein OS493_002112, partial [Desmophyllum pertusum]
IQRSHPTLINAYFAFSKSASNIELRRRKMDFNHGFALLCVLLAISIHNSNSHCANGMCEKVSLSLATNTKQNFALVGYVFETLGSLWNWQECSQKCLNNCQCLSFNFNEVNTTENCELNDANTKLAPEALTEKEGVIYYEPVRSYYDKNVSK